MSDVPEPKLGLLRETEPSDTGAGLLPDAATDAGAGVPTMWCRCCAKPALVPGVDCQYGRIVLVGRSFSDCIHDSLWWVDIPEQSAHGEDDGMHGDGT